MEIKKIEICENGIFKEYDVLFTIKNEVANKFIIIYTDINSDIDIYAAYYNEKTKEINYIDDLSDQELVKKAIDIIKEKLSREV